jgi:hypothetical protein
VDLGHRGHRREGLLPGAPQAPEQARVAAGCALRGRGCAAAGPAQRRGEEGRAADPGARLFARRRKRGSCRDSDLGAEERGRVDSRVEGFKRRRRRRRDGLGGGDPPPRRVGLLGQRRRRRQRRRIPRTTSTAAPRPSRLARRLPGRAHLRGQRVVRRGDGGRCRAAAGAAAREIWG